MRKGVIVCLILLSCCRVREPRSSIVEMVEAAGSGPLAGVSTPAIAQWFALHKDVAYQIDEMCRPVRGNAAAQWGDSTEGHVCDAAAQIRASRPPDIGGDSRTFSPVPDSHKR